MRKNALIVVLGLVMAVVPFQAFSLPLMTETIMTDYHWFEDDHTYMYASIVDFYNDRPDTWEDGVWIGTGDGMESSLAWSHSLPPGLSVPPGKVYKAKLKIDAEYVDEAGNLVEIQGTWDWDPLEYMWWNDNTTYVLSDVDQEGFWNTGSLDVGVWAGETDLRIDEAILMMDYAYVVPEPASLLLVGLGLVGAAVYRRARKG